VERGYIKIPPFFVNLVGLIVTLTVGILFLRFEYGLDLTGILVGSTIITFIVGFSLQEILGSLFTGIILQFDSPVDIGDWIKVGDVEGELVGANWRTLTILTPARNEVFLPNIEIAKSQITNYSRPSAKQRYEIELRLAHNNPPEIVKKVILRTIKDIDLIAQTPEPGVWVSKFEQSDLTYTIQYWIENHHDGQSTQDEVLTHIWYSLARAGIGDHFGVHKDDNLLPEERRLGYRDTILDKIQKSLRGFGLLMNLSDAQIKILSEAAQLNLYATGEDLVREGEEGDSMFFIKSGDVKIYIDRNEENQIPVDRRVAGEFFGEMSLLTGQVRSATVTANSPVEVITISKEGFVKVLTVDPTIVKILLDALEQRQQNLASKNQEATARAQQREEERNQLLYKIKEFLDI
jgi:CRP-like cAMP-binding protein